MDDVCVCVYLFADIIVCFRIAYCVVRLEVLFCRAESAVFGLELLFVE